MENEGFFGGGGHVLLLSRICGITETLCSCEIILQTGPCVRSVWIVFA